MLEVAHRLKEHGVHNGIGDGMVRLMERNSPGNIWGLWRVYGEVLSMDFERHLIEQKTER